MENLSCEQIFWPRDFLLPARDAGSTRLIRHVRDAQVSDRCGCPYLVFHEWRISYAPLRHEPHRWAHRHDLHPAQQLQEKRDRQFSSHVLSFADWDSLSIVMKCSKRARAAVFASVAEAAWMHTRSYDSRMFTFGIEFRISLIRSGFDHRKVPSKSFVQRRAPSIDAAVLRPISSSPQIVNWREVSSDSAFTYRQLDRP